MESIFFIDKNKLIIFLFIAAVLGLILLFLYSENILPREIKISEVKVTPVNSYIKIEGRINEIKESEKMFTVKVCDLRSFDECVSVYIFKSDAPLLFEGDKVVISGIIKEWKNNYYIEVKKSTDIIILQ